MGKRAELDKEQCIANLLEAMEQAIKSGDWKVDGACDPDWAIAQAKYVLRESGRTQNSIDASWMIAD
jgi:hypothetical protein